MKTKLCKWCGKEFQAKSAKTMYCSEHCRKMFRKKYKQDWYAKNKDRINEERKEDYTKKKQDRDDRIVSAIDNAIIRCEKLHLYD